MSTPGEWVEDDYPTYNVTFRMECPDGRGFSAISHFAGESGWTVLDGDGNEIGRFGTLREAQAAAERMAMAEVGRGMLVLKPDWRARPNPKDPREDHDP